MDLLELVQLAWLAKVDRLLMVKAESSSGMILFNARGVFHAECGSKRGESALREMALAQRGTFESLLPEGDEPSPSNARWRTFWSRRSGIGMKMKLERKGAAFRTSLCQSRG